MINSRFVSKFIVLLLVLPVLVCFFTDTVIDGANISTLEYNTIKFEYCVSFAYVIIDVVMLIMNLLNESHPMYEISCLSGSLLVAAFGLAGTIILAMKEFKTIVLATSACMMTGGVIAIFDFLKTYFQNT